MQLYRLFIFDRFGRRIEETQEFRAVDDQTAIELTGGWRRARKAELWGPGRPVRTWSAGAPAFER